MSGPPQAGLVLVVNTPSRKIALVEPEAEAETSFPQAFDFARIIGLYVLDSPAFKGSFFARHERDDDGTFWKFDHVTHDMPDEVA